MTDYVDTFPFLGATLREYPASKAPGDTAVFQVFVGGWRVGKNYTTRAGALRAAERASASDGAYQPHLDAKHDLYAELDDDPRATTLQAFVDLAVETSAAATPDDPYADNATALLADL